MTVLAFLLAVCVPAFSQVPEEKPSLDALFDGMPELRVTPSAPPPFALRFGLALERWSPLPADLPGDAVPAPAPAPDSDGDGMEDDEELRLARAVAPTLTWAKSEGCGAHDLLFQVHPSEDGKARVTFVLVFPIDCGFRSHGLGGHSGDVQEIVIDAARGEDGEWHAALVDLPWHRAFKPKSDHAELFVSSGKHHVYPDEAGCRWGRFLFLDSCGGGAVEALMPEQARNVGEDGRAAFTTLAGLGRPPWPDGYAAEMVWGPSAAGDGFFCGGDPKRGGLGGFWAKLKKLVGWDSCGDAIGGKWAK